MALMDFIKSRSSPRKSNSDSHEKKSGEWRQIVNDFGRYLEINPPAGEIRDVKCLPHPKQDIKDALLRGLCVENDKHCRKIEVAPVVWTECSIP